MAAWCSVALYWPAEWAKALPPLSSRIFFMGTPQQQNGAQLSHPCAPLPDRSGQMIFALQSRIHR